MAKRGHKRVSLFKAEAPKKKQIQKALFFTNKQYEDQVSTQTVGEVLEPPYPIDYLLSRVEYSTILQQCIEAYKQNIPGFGVEVKYTVDDVVSIEDAMRIQAKHDQVQQQKLQQQQQVNQSTGQVEQATPGTQKDKNIQKAEGTQVGITPVGMTNQVTSGLEQTPGKGGTDKNNPPAPSAPEPGSPLDGKTLETPEMKAEWEALEEYVKYFNFDKAFHDVWKQAIEDRERCGNGYVEILRDGTGMPSGGENVQPQYMKIGKLQDPIEVVYTRNGKEFKRFKRFRKYLQQIGSYLVYFKEFGDPRQMDYRNGVYYDTTKGEKIPDEKYLANEIIHIKIGNQPYGIPRWIGQLVHMEGARKAEELNFNYFLNGRHTPAAITVSNGTLTQESADMLQEYVNSTAGVENAHKFLLIEAEGLEEGLVPGEGREPVKVDIKPLTEILQQDALFLEYDDASRMKIQSAFRVPDLYVGRSKDFNRATATEARQVTEEQVFDPERESLEFIINHILLGEYGFNFVELEFCKPDISDVDEKAALIAAYTQVGGVAPNDVREDVGRLLGKKLENFPQPEANAPVQLQQMANQQALQATQLQVQAHLSSQALAAKGGQEPPKPGQTPVQKEYYMDDFLSILKDVRNSIKKED